MVSWVPRVDSEFGDYRIQALIGHGGMSVVYLAQHKTLERRVALKIMSPALTDSKDFQERFTRESRMAAALDHPNIIPIYEAGEQDGVFFISMRYVDGSDLKHLIQREGPLSPQRTSSLIGQVASALATAHEERLVHRDIKPANILIAKSRSADGGDHVYLSDFGVAKHTASRVALTQTGLFVGTADYAAPEQIEGGPLDGRADIYALGCVLYECLAGEMPYDKDSEVAMMYAHLLEQPPRVTERRPDLPPGIDGVIAKAMAKQRDDRYESAMAFSAAVREELAKLPEAVPAATSSDTAGGREAAPASDRPAAGRETVLAGDAPAAGRETVLAGDAPAAGRETVLASPPTSVGGHAGSAERPADEAAPGAGRAPGGAQRLLVPALLVLLLAAVAAIGFLLFAGDDDGGSAAGQTPAPPPAAGAGNGAGAGPPAASPQPTGDVSQLESLVEAPVWRDCAVKSVPDRGALQSAICLGGSSGGDAFTPDRIEMSIYPNAGALRAAYTAARTAAGLRTDFGRCSGTSWGGEGEWLHGPDKPGGHRLCHFDGNDAVIMWTHEKLGQETHAHFLASAREGGSSHDRLFSWWRFWHHRLGKLVE